MNDKQRRKMVEDAMTLRSQPQEVKWVISYPARGSRFTVHVEAHDATEYALKGIPSRTCQRQPRDYFYKELFIEQLVGNLAPALAALVPPVGLLELPTSLVEQATWLRCLIPGLCHGIQWIDRAEEVRDLTKVAEADLDDANRIRMGALAVLLGWISNSPGDSQYLIESQPPHRLWSVDHGLLADSIPVFARVKKENIWQGFGLRPHHSITRALKRDKYDKPHEVVEIRDAAHRLMSVTDEQIASTVAAPPESWRVGLKQRVDLMRYLQRRRDELSAMCLE